MVSSHSLKIHDFRSCPFGFSIPTVYVPNKTLGVVIQYGKWSAHQGASFGMVSSHIWKNTDFRLQYFVQLAIDFPIKISFGICSKQLLAMKNRFLTLPKSETLHFDEFLTIWLLKSNIVRKISKFRRQLFSPGVTICSFLRWFWICNPFCLKLCKMTRWCSGRCPDKLWCRSDETATTRRHAATSW